MEKGTILLVSCYELGHQPLALASPLAFLERAGHLAEALDISVEPLDPAKLAQARLVAISVPMHTALRLGVRVAEQIRRVNPGCHICFYGLYASLNADYLLEHCGDSVIGGEYESALVTVVTKSNIVPFACIRLLVAVAETSSRSVGAIARCWVTELRRCTLPMAAYGNALSVMIPMCSRKASMCG